MLSMERFFKPAETAAEKQKLKEFKEHLPPGSEDKMIFFWNNRNARRKQSGTLIFWFKEFLDKIGREKSNARDAHRCKG